MKTVEFIFDFGSPNAYLAWRILKPMAFDAGAKLVVVPCLLGGIFKTTGNQPPMVAFGGVKGKLAYEMLEMRRFIARHGLTAFTMNPHFPVNTLAIMRGLVAAQVMGVEEVYVETVLGAMWEQGLKMDDRQVVSEALAAGGLDGEALLALSNTAEVKAQLAANTENAVARGVFGIPTFFVGPDMWFGKDRLDQVKEALLA